MSDEVDYGTYDQQTYGNMDTGDEQMAQDRFNQNILQDRDACGTDGCQNTENPGEAPWLELMSAIPVAGQINNIHAMPTGMGTPNDLEVSEIVGMLRGADGDDYAIEAVSEGWDNFKLKFEPLESALTTALTDLSQEWTGDDFESFSEAVATVKRNLVEIKTKITDSEGVLPMLKERAQAIYQLQGGDSGEVPYPAPLIWVDDRGMWKRAEVHIRPAFWDGDCEKHPDAFANESGEKIMELAGMDPSYQDEVHNFVTDRANYYYEFYNSEANGYQPGSFTMEQAQQMAQQDADGQITQDATDVNEQYQARLENVNTDIASRRDYANNEVESFTPEPPATEPTGLGDNQPTNPYPTPTGGGGGSMPSGTGGLGDMNPPSTSMPDSPTTPSFDPPPTNTTDPNLPNTTDPDGLDDNPWDPTTPDPDDIPSGGLASGGGGGLGGGGLGPGGGGLGGGAGGGLGAGAGGGVGGGGMGGMMGAGGMGRGGGAGAGAGGKGAGGRGGGRMGGMMGAGGGRGMGAGQEGDKESGTWLTEDDDVWGIGNEETDPYA